MNVTQVRQCALAAAALTVGMTASFTLCASASGQQTQLAQTSIEPFLAPPHAAVTAVALPNAAPPDLPQAPSAVLRPLTLTGGVVVEPERPGALSLTLDQAISVALKNNSEVKVRTQQETFVRGQQLSAFQALLPTLSASGYARAQEINLAAMGFKPGVIHIQGVNTNDIPQIVKVNTANAQLNLSTSLTTTALFLYRATERAREATNWATLNAEGGVVLEVGGLYLRALADQASVRNAQALVKQDQLVFEHAKASRDAGVGINLDVLRAQVELQQEQQALITAINNVAKDKVMLNRAMGQPAGQDLDLIDAVPYSDFNADSSDRAIQDALAVAYVRRKDLRQLEAQLEVARETGVALKYERLPTIAFGGFYGVLGQIGGLYHGDFVAEGQVSIPIFQEAQLRGQKEVSAAQEMGLRNQIAGTRAQIEADIRSSLLDVQSAAELVKVSRSNVTLARQALDDATMRFTAGVDDDLAVVRAQASLVGAEAQVIQAEFNYNYSKLVLARNTGVVETQYRTYLGK
jgi:outer membrane protein TolC